MVALSKPPAGDTDWATEINQNWTDLENALNAGTGDVNYILNPGFEIMPFSGAGYTISSTEGRTGFPGWFGAGSGTAVGGATPETTAANVKSGLRSAKVTVTTAGGGGSYLLLKQRIRVGNIYDFRGKTITFSCELKTSTASFARVRLIDSAGSTDSSFHTGGGSFEKLSVSRTIDSNATYVEAAVYVDGTILATAYADEALLLISSSSGTFRTGSPNEQLAVTRGLFAARLEIGGSNTDIRLRPFPGGLVEVDGEYVFIDDQNGIVINTSTNRIDASGADAGAALGASTLYYAYVSNSQASYAPRSLRLSLQSPTNAYLGDGQPGRYLGLTGNSRNWRFVGWVKTNASTQFVDSETQRFVVNYYNRRSLSLRTVPGYSDDNAVTTYNLNSSSWTTANGGTGSRLEFIANGEDAVLATAHFSNVDTGTTYNVGVGIGLDSTTTPVQGTIGNVNSAREPQSVSHHYVPAEGYRYLELLLRGSVSMSVVADQGRNGASADVAVTSLTATIRG